MFPEPWSDIREYPERHKAALEAELVAELGKKHLLPGREFNLLAKRDDRDDVLVSDGVCFYIIHLTWSGRTESESYPKTEQFMSKEQLDTRLAQDSQWY